MKLRLHPGVTLLAALALGGLLEAVVPAAPPLSLATRLLTGGPVLATAVALLSTALLVLHRAGTSAEPHDQPSAIVTTGPFRWSRNPMYLANVLAIVAFALLTASPWFLLTAAAQLALLDRWVIPAEEERLRRAFPHEAVRWFATTGRWLPRVVAGSDVAQPAPTRLHLAEQEARVTDIRIFVNEAGDAGFLCPRCGADNRLTLDSDDPGMVETAVSCACGYRGQALVDKRRATRMTVTLSGEVETVASRPRPITVRVLSRLGLGFEVPDGTQVAIGDEVAVELFLQDVGAAVIRKKAIVRNVKGRFAGAEFVVRSPPSTYDKICERALTVYLQGGDPDGY